MIWSCGVNKTLAKIILAIGCLVIPATGMKEVGQLAISLTRLHFTLEKVKMRYCLHYAGDKYDSQDLSTTTMEHKLHE
jgi:hypothetical protein